MTLKSEYIKARRRLVLTGLGEQHDQDDETDRNTE
jgi:hypothetical protein